MLSLVLQKIKIIKFYQVQKSLRYRHHSSKKFDFRTALTSNSYWNLWIQKTTESRYSHLEKLLEQVEAFSSLATIVASLWRQWLRKNWYLWRKFCQNTILTLKSIQDRWLRAYTAFILSKWRVTIKLIWFSWVTHLDSKIAPTLSESMTLKAQLSKDL